MSIRAVTMSRAPESRAGLGAIIRGTSLGMIPMAVFTPLYAVWLPVAWPIPGTILLIAALVWSAYLAATGVRLLRLSRTLPAEPHPDDARIERGMSVVSSLQGVAILISAVMLVIFGRTIDYYLGTVMLVVALLGLYLSAQPDVEWQTTWGVVGLGGMLVTSS